MKYTDLVFDLYGTLVDIHTEVDDLVWEKTAFYFGFHGAHYTPEELKAAFEEELGRREATAGQSYECFPDIPYENIMTALFQAKGVTENAESLGFNASQLQRINSIEYIRLYPGVLEALATLRERGFRLWLLSNAQRVFTEYELRHLELGPQFDRVFISSDYGYRKPDTRFYTQLLREQNLLPKNCLMIGNDRDTDIEGAKNVGMATLYMHTDLTPSQQAKADPTLLPQNAPTDCRHFEFEGDNWQILTQVILDICQ